MVDHVGTSQRLDESLNILAEETTELGVHAEDVFKNSAAALFGHGEGAALSALEGADFCARMRQEVHLRALDMLTRYTPIGQEMRRLIEIQQIAKEFAQIATKGRQIAEHALALGGTGDVVLQRVGGAVPTLMWELVRQVYVEVRGCVIATTTRDTVLAKRLVSEDAELDRLFQLFKAAMDEAISASPQEAPPLQRLLLVGVLHRDIGNCVQGICRVLLFTPPQQLP
jgi:phosphate uptake regulator